VPTVEIIAKSTADPNAKLIRGENGVGEWYGTARFDHPSPAEPGHLKRLFPRHYDENYKPIIKPNVTGETIADLHDRTAYALHRIIEKSDREGVKAILICTHAATLIAIGRALVGRMPEDIAEEDFRPFTCGVSTFVRRKGSKAQKGVGEWEGPEKEIPRVQWRGGRGVGGGWDLTVSGDCSFLSGGEERGW
jgi:transcription factor C subunit 7